jgi:peroxiredoxin
MNAIAKISKLTAVTIVAIALLLCCIGCKAATGSQAEDKATDFTLSTIAGDNINLRNLEGKPVLISFWTTGCGACIYQMSLLQDAQKELKDKIVFIEIDIAEDNYTVKRCMDYYGFSLPVALDSDASVARAYNVRYTPTNVIIDSKGVIQQIKIGAFRNTTAVLTALSDVK